MKFARYWKRGRAEAQSPSGQLVTVTSWGWSESAEEEADRRAAEIARRAAGRVEAGEPWPPHGYGYAERPPREEIVEEMRDDDGVLAAAVTRNSYGSLILNTSDFIFIDVDIPHEPAGGGLVSAIRSLFGKETDDAETTTRRKIEAAAARRPEYTFRLYRTFAGFRCAVVNRRLDAGSPESRRLLEEFGADPLYVRLCQNQKSYRARLTPKYWRCGGDRPPSRFPWETEEGERRYRAWETAYAEWCGGFATCRLVGQFGTQPASAALMKLVRLHDGATKADSGLELA
jgi:hypothetical protein